MKKIYIIAMAAIMALCATAALAAEKLDRLAAKEAKKLEKEGWMIRPGSLPLEQQLLKSYELQSKTDEDLYPLYIMGEATSVGENYDAAKTAAISLALNNLAGQIQTELTALIENTVVNKQLTAEEAVSISETVMTSKSLISQSLGRTMPVMECYRLNSKKNTEVLVRIAYSQKKAKAQALKAVKEEMERKGEKVNEQLDKILGL
ncbi:MAG: hypothetical protein E7074_06110 [Bacteroidales bacterium]|jgi:hypothetical protein|nr:hypothetical protein [Bacteroidales bacterium]MBR4459996.1 hypothetical protein [Paludibacteraceae bacterium]MBR4546574.1 hypothetical protein [Paludibacteraceae bacterium]